MGIKSNNKAESYYNYFGDSGADAGFAVKCGTCKWYGNRGLFLGGYTNTQTNIIDYVTIWNTGNATDFGDLTAVRYGPASCSNGTRGLCGGGHDNSNATAQTDYIVIATTGNAVSQGDLTQARFAPAAVCDGSRGVFAGGDEPGGGAYVDTIDYFSVATTGNATDFGNLLSSGKKEAGGCSNSTRGLFGGGKRSDAIDEISYITIQTSGNATVFGDLTEELRFLGACSSATRGLFGGGSDANGTQNNVVNYVTIDTTGNATDFGDLTVARRNLAATQNGPEGGDGGANPERGIFGGGNVSGTNSNVIDRFSIPTAGNASDFGDLTVARTDISACSGA